MDEWAGKKVVIVGLARQGTALARFACQAGATVVVTDLRTSDEVADARAELRDLEIEYVLGQHPVDMLKGTDLMAISGAVPADAPIVTAAREQGIRISNDSHEFIRRSPSAVIGVTGSAGKTTTTALTGVMGQVDGRRTWVGGNIGRPLISDLHKMGESDLVVQELSSFQLELWEQSPPIASVLNITPNHLDRHRTMANYVGAKSNILRYQTANDTAVLPADDPGALRLQPLVQGRLRQFSSRREVEDGAFVRDSQIWLRNGREKAVCLLSRIKLRGHHNLLNVLASVVLADTADISLVAMEEAIDSFHGVEHRLELIRTINGVSFVNDSIATAPERAVAAIKSYDEPIVLLAGGRDKDMEWGGWAKTVCERVRHVILFGELAEQLESLLTRAGMEGRPRKPEISSVNTVEDALLLATQSAKRGEVVLLSPGGTSFDAFTDFAERGTAFRELVMRLGT